MGFAGGAHGKEPTYHCRRYEKHRFNCWVGRNAWRRAWQPTPVFLPGESHGQKILAGIVHGVGRVGHDLATIPPPPGTAWKSRVGTARHGKGNPTGRLLGSWRVCPLFSVKPPQNAWMFRVL